MALGVAKHVTDPGAEEPGGRTVRWQNRRQEPLLGPCLLGFFAAPVRNGATAGGSSGPSDGGKWPSGCCSSTGRASRCG
ncbi:hypothetical protein ARZXY2_4226 [Arthrobacter sp. ZXY-2]|nr:hypothetical protein ARZXY2_4226 [Arthrobacter sp. ZXY-2]